MEKICIECKDQPVYIKKRQLCSRCYQRKRKEENGFSPGFDGIKCNRTKEKVIHKKELEFVRNYFSHQEWLYQPALFRLESGAYSPDFYDQRENVFIEVAGSRQAYHINKQKYNEFSKTFPEIILEIRTSNGELLNTKNPEWKKNNGN